MISRAARLGTMFGLVLSFRTGVASAQEDRVDVARLRPAESFAGGFGDPLRVPMMIDDWTGHDKLLHFEASAAIAAGGYGVGALFSDDVRVRLLAGAALGLSAGVAKELWDLSGRGDASFRDLTWDVVGTITGLAVATGIDWTIRWAVRRHRALPAASGP